MLVLFLLSAQEAVDLINLILSPLVVFWETKHFKGVRNKFLMMTEILLLEFSSAPFSSKTRILFIGFL